MIQALGGVEGILEHTLFKGPRRGVRIGPNFDRRPRLMATSRVEHRHVLPDVGGPLLGEGALRRPVAFDRVRIHSKSQEKPLTTSSPGDESRRRRETAARPPFHAGFRF